MVVVNGWTIYAHPLLLDQFEKLTTAVEKARAKDPEGWAGTASAKVLTSVSLATVSTVSVLWAGAWAASRVRICMVQAATGASVFVLRAVVTRTALAAALKGSWPTRFRVSMKRSPASRWAR